MIRAYTQQDCGRVMEIWLAANLDAHDFLPAAYWQENFKAVEQDYLPAAQSFVWEEEGRLLGFISVLEESFIGALFVDAAARGRGIGFSLISHCQQRFQPLSLTVFKENTRASAFYRRCGFVVETERESDCPGHAEYLMQWRGA